VSAPIEVVALGAAWDDWSRTSSFPFSPDHCVNGTRVAIRVLERLGIAAKPMSVSIGLFNRPGWDLSEAGVPPEEWPAHAHSVGVTPGAIGPRTDRFDGHLVAEGEDWVLDVSARQFHRPGRIEHDAPLLLADTVLPSSGWLIVDCPGIVVVIGRTPWNNAWREASGWKREQVAEIEECLRRTNLVLAGLNALRGAK
jgi:hypothetical protein